jgi:pimeloyl-ACP methyl ester carboxylesterase
VVDLLQAQGHRVHALTLTGVGERAHLLSPEIHLSTHIQDVVAAIDHEELQDVVLAVHSYAGMVGTGVADRLPERLRHLVYVDAVVPKPGEAWSATHASSTREARLSAARADPLYSFPPPGPELFGLAGEDAAWVARRQTPHPGHPYSDVLDFDPARVARVPRTYIHCTRPTLATIDAIWPRVNDPKFWDGHWLPGSRRMELATGHDPMISAPKELTEILLAAAD